MLEERRKKKKNKANVGCSNVSVDVCWDALRTAEMGTAFCGCLPDVKHLGEAVKSLRIVALPF